MYVYRQQQNQLMVSSLIGVWSKYHMDILGKIYDRISKIGQKLRIMISNHPEYLSELNKLRDIFPNSFPN